MDLHQLTTIFCEIDDFCKELDNYSQHKLLPDKVQSSRGGITSFKNIIIKFGIHGIDQL